MGTSNGAASKPIRTPGRRAVGSGTWIMGTERRPKRSSWAATDHSKTLRKTPLGRIARCERRRRAPQREWLPVRSSSRSWSSSVPTRPERTATTMIRGSWPSNPRQPRRALGWMTDRAAVCGNAIEWFSCFRLRSKWNPGTGGGSFCGAVTRLLRIAYFLEIESLARPRTPPPSHAEGTV